MNSTYDLLIKLTTNATSVSEEIKGVTKELSSAWDQLLKLSEAGKENTKEFKELENQISKLETKNKALADTAANLDTQFKQVLETHNNLNSVLKRSIKTQSDYEQQSADLIKIRANLNTEDENYQYTLDKINKKLAENDKCLDDIKNNYAASTSTLKDYKNQVTESFNAINVFNGGLSGIITRSQEAGGAGKLVTGAFSGMAQGIAGMTRSALAFIATPIGFVIAALSVAVKAVASYFEDTQEGMDALTAVTRPLQAVMAALMEVFAKAGGILVGLFTSPAETVKKLGNLIKDNILNRFTGMMELIPNLAKAMGLLLKGDFSEAGKVAINAVNKAVLGIGTGVDAMAQKTAAFFKTAWEKGQQIDTLQKKIDKGLADYTTKNAALSVNLSNQNRIANDTNQTFSKREIAAKQALETLRQQNKLVQGRLDDEIALFKLKTKNTDAEKAQLAEMEAKRAEMVHRNIDGERELNNRINSIRNEAYEKNKERNKKAMEDALNKQKQQLELYVNQNQGIAKTLQEQLKFEQEKADKSLKILKNELKLSKISQDEYNLQKDKITREKEGNILQLNTNFSKAMLEVYKLQHQSILKEGEKLTKDTVEQEKKRLDELLKMQLEQLDKESGLKNPEKIKSKEDITNEAEAKYFAESLRLKDEYNKQYLALDKQLEDANKQRNDEKKQQEQDNANKKLQELEVKKVLAETEYEQKLADEDLKNQQEKDRYKKLYDDKLITDEQYSKHVKLIDEETQKNKQRLAIQNVQTQLGSMQQLAGALTDAFGQNKELAMAQATMNAGQAILSIWAGTISANPVVDAIIKTALSASTAVKTAKQIKEIQSTKKPKEPKFEKGGLVTIGGKRHSEGGTIFTGTDGTRFEAEAGEIIGVMNRNAARHFMAFNNAFASGTGIRDNYFATGGIVSREVSQQGINIDELAAKIALANASMPAPVVSVQDIINQTTSTVKVQQGANF